MLWESVIDGLKVFLYWETYVLALIYLLVMYIPYYPLLLRKVHIKKGGCLPIILQPFFQAIGSIIYVVTLFPILLGIGDNVAWSAPWILFYSEPLITIVLIIFMVAIMVITDLIPFIGRMTSVKILVSGGTVILFMIKILSLINPSFNISRIDLIPGVLITAGIIIISILVSYTVLLLSALLLVLIDKNDEGLTTILIIPITSFVGFIPVFIYGAWIGNQLL